MHSLERETLQKRIKEVESILQAFRKHQVDAVIGEADVAVLKLEKVERTLHESESALIESDIKYSTLFHSALDSIFVHDLDGNILDINKTAISQFGYSLVEVRKKNIRDLHPASTLDVQRRAFAQVEEQSYVRYEIECLTKSGQSFIGEVSANCFMLHGELCVQGIVRNIDDRKQAEKTIHMLSSSIKQASEAIIITDTDGSIEYINPAFTELTGYQQDEAIGQNPRLLKSGEQDERFYNEMWEKLTQGKAWQGRIVDRKKDGSSYPALLTVSPIKDESGETTHYVGIQLNLIEHETLERQLHQAQKMEAIGTLVGGIAHDFNNILAGMTGNLYLAKKRVKGLPEVTLKLNSVEELALRASAMIGQLLTFARKGQVSMQPMPLSPFIKETIKFLRTAVPENIDIKQNICSDPILILGDGTQLHQVLMNLVNNARDALEGRDDPSIDISLGLFQPDDAFIEKHAYFKHGDYAHLSVADNGCGVPETQVEHLFEPFFTTKEEGKGTGLGLAMVFGAVKSHQGFIEVDSSEGVGTRFDLYLPMYQAQADVIIPNEEQQVAEGNGELILLVDDQEQIILTGKEVLESLGYRVITAINGKQAVAVFESQPGEIKLVILDVIMPEMGGHDAAQRMRQISPNVNVIFSTGYDKSTQQDLKHEKVLSKPFSIIEMSHLIQDRLNVKKKSVVGRPQADIGNQSGGLKSRTEMPGMQFAISDQIANSNC